MSTAKFSDDFKRDAVNQLVERGYPVAEVSGLRLRAGPNCQDTAVPLAGCISGPAGLPGAKPRR